MPISRRFALMLLATAVLAAGCAAPRTAEIDNGVRSVAVISLVEEAAPIQHLGLTVFNNHRGTVEQNGKLRQTVIATVTQRLKTSRPQWTVKADGTDPAVPAFQAKKDVQFESFAETNMTALTETARRLDVDQLLIVMDSRSENHPGRGVGITMRAISNDPDAVMVHSFIAFYVFDRQGKELVRRGATNDNPKRVRNAELGLRADMSTLAEPAVRDKVSLALQDRLQATVEEAMTRAGY